MSAVVRVVPNADMEILDKYLSEEGVVLIPQSLAAEINPDTPHDVDELYLDGYDFGGDADVWVDIARTVDHMAVDRIKVELEKEKG